MTLNTSNSNHLASVDLEGLSRFNFYLYSSKIFSDYFYFYSIRFINYFYSTAGVQTLRSQDTSDLGHF